MRDQPSTGESGIQVPILPVRALLLIVLRCSGAFGLVWLITHYGPPDLRDPVHARPLYATGVILTVLHLSGWCIEVCKRWRHRKTILSEQVR